MTIFNPTTALRAACTAMLLTLGLSASVYAAGSAAPDDKGRHFYEKVCSRCHETGIGPVLLGRDLPPIFFTTMARLGRGAMPAFRISDVDDETLQAVAEYLSKTKAKP